MQIYRNPMEKILKEAENDTVITNPKEPFRTFLRKVMFILARWMDRLIRAFNRGRPR